MRFHHSTRRRTRHSVAGGANIGVGTGGAGSSGCAGSSAAAARWSLNYCRETNIHFNRRLPVEPPAEWSVVPHAIATSSHSVEHAAGAEGRDQGVDTLELGERMSLNLRVDDAINLQHQQQQDQCDISANEKVNNYHHYQQTPSISNNQDLNNHHNHSKSVSRKSSNKYNDNINMSNTNRDNLDMDSIREKLLSQVKKHPFWSNKAAKRMHLDFLERRRIYIYELVSFCERRQLEWRYEPYRGGLVQSVPYAILQQDELQATTTQTTHNLSPNNNNIKTNLEQPTTLMTVSPLHHHHRDSPNNQLQEASDSPARRPQQATKQQLLAPIGKQQSGKRLRPSARNPMARSSSTTSSPRDHQTLDQQDQFSRQNLSSPFRYSDQQHASTAASCTQTQNNNNNLVDASGSRSGSVSINPSQSQAYDGGKFLTSLEPVPLPVQPLGAIQRPLPSSEQIWSIPLGGQSLGPQPFKGYSHSRELANSSFVKRCHGCQGKGRLKCKSCHGVGYEVCISCSGKGTQRNFHSRYSSSNFASSAGFQTANSMDCSRGAGITGNGGGITWSSGDGGSGGGGGIDSISDSRASKNESHFGQANQSSSTWVTESCHFCHGAGQKRCWVCAGKSYNHCPGCFGAGRLRCFLMLHIIFLNHRDESFLNNSDEIIPKDRLRLASGRQILNEIEHQLNPLSPEKLIRALDEGGKEAGLIGLEMEQFAQVAAGANLGSLGSLDDICLLQSTCRKLMDKHKEIYRNERLIKQRQTITQIETDIVSYEWKRRSGKFAIYGNERKVFIAKYPYKSICNIT